MKVTSSSGMLKTLIYHIVTEHFLERENWKAFKFHLNDFSYFEMSATFFKSRHPITVTPLRLKIE